MSKKMKCLVKTLHLLFACFWLGAATSIVLLQCLEGWSEDGRLLQALNQNFAILDLALIIPGAMGSALTGFVICQKTSWGLTRYWWIIIKGILTIAAILVGTALLGPWQLKMVELSSQPEHLLLAGGTYDLIRVLFTIAGFLQVLTLIVIITIAAVKPWGKRVAGQREADRVRRRSEATV